MIQIKCKTGYSLPLKDFRLYSGKLKKHSMLEIEIYFLFFLIFYKKLLDIYFNIIYIINIKIIKKEIKTYDKENF